MGTGETPRRAHESVAVPSEEAAEARFRALVEQLPAIVYTEAIAEGATLEYISPQVEIILGISPSEWMDDPEMWRKVIHPDDRDRVLAQNDRVNRTGEPYDAQYRVIARDGRVVWFHDTAAVVRDEEGVPRFWQGVMLDVTERLATAERLREAEAQYRTLVEQTPLVVYLYPVGPSDISMHMSPQIEALIGYTPEEMTGQGTLWHELIHPEDRQRVLAASTHHQATGEPFDTEYRIIARDGGTVWVHDRSVLVRDELGNARFWQGVLIDITERKRREELETALEGERAALTQLREVDEMKTTFLRAVSHDLRTPLAAILGLGMTLERGTIRAGSQEVRDLAGRIVANARKLDRLVGDLLDLDRLSRGAAGPSLERTDISWLIRGVVSDGDPTEGRPVELDLEPAIADVDPSKVERIVANLLGNAARHTPPGTRVWVRARAERDGVVIVVEDEGPGVPSSHRAGIFEPFQRGPGTSERVPGVGVGLALVSGFAELHGGRAWVQDREGGGASFHVFLPGRGPTRGLGFSPREPSSPGDG